MMHTNSFEAHSAVEPSNPLLDQLMVEMGMGFNAYLERHEAIQQLQLLQSLSDAQLAERGLRRDMILDHVLQHLGAGTRA